MNIKGLNGISVNTAALLGVTIEKLIKEKIATSQTLENVPTEEIAAEIRDGMYIFIEQVSIPNLIAYINASRNK